MNEHRFVRGHAEGSDIEAAGAIEDEVQLIVGDFEEQLAAVAIIVATREERIAMEECGRELTSRGIDHQFFEISPHRNAGVFARFVEDAAIKGVRVIIAAGGVVPAMASTVASFTALPVIGVPLSNGALNGLDALLATAQSAPGVPVACMSVDGIRNSAIFASRILSAIPMPPR
ncbi:MAG: AIR carboxylase family protein [Thermoleophilia bacterium]|nr:AIR carboxylase family protein [Thermoleophilia bacterium]